MIKHHNELLNLINATVSHELRNPLNSICSQGLENQVLFKQICQILERGEVELEMNTLKAIMKKLNQGQKTLSSSTKLMTNLIQDLLDYAQIKAGKFRKNLKRFNIHDTIEEIMSIQ